VKETIRRASQTAARRRLDRRLIGLDARVGPVPGCGWIRTIRDALGMSTFELAGRLGVTRARVSQFEQAEVHRSIPLSSLDRVAAALECRVNYVLVPEVSLEQIVLRQALDQAAKVVAASLLPTDGAEHEPPAADEVAARVAALAHELMDRRGLWRLKPLRY
jgi:predicted DNA-binding mobile mystery protein A